MELIADALTRIRNATVVNGKEVTLRKNKTVLAIADVLKNEGFITDYTDGDSEITLELKYDKGIPSITHLERVSKGGQRVYVNASEMKPVLNGRGIGIISTSSGVMTTDEAAEKNIGGEYICKVW